MKVIKAIYNFIVGDMIILIGVIIAMLILALIYNVAALAPLRAISGFILVILAGLLVRAPLTRVPENTLKFVVGVMLTTFGTFWAGEGFGVVWPYADAFLLVLAAIYLLASFALVTILKQHKQRQVALADATKDSLEAPEQEVLH